MKVETQTQTTKTYTLHLTSQEAEDLRTLLHLSVSTLSTALPAKLVDRAVPGLSQRGNEMHRALMNHGAVILDEILHLEDELRQGRDSLPTAIPGPSLHAAIALYGGKSVLMEQTSGEVAKKVLDSGTFSNLPRDNRKWEVQFQHDDGSWTRSRRDMPHRYSDRAKAYEAMRSGTRRADELSYRVARAGDYSNAPGHYELEAVIGGKWKRVPGVYPSENAAYRAACRNRRDSSMVNQWRTVFVKE